MAKPTELAPAAGDWRLDFRLVDHLPEDSVIGQRFVANTIAAAVATAAVLACAWSSYTLYTTVSGIADWEDRIASTAVEVRQIERLQREYAFEAGRIDEIHTLMRNPIAMTTFLTEFARVMPPEVNIDMFETRENKLIIRGQLADGSERASRLVGTWVSSLSKHEVLGPPFSEIKLTGLERFDDEDGLSFEISLTKR